MKKILVCILLSCFLVATSCFAKNTGFTEQDRERLVRLEVLWMLVAIFTTLTAVVIGFAYWDRRN